MLNNSTQTSEMTEKPKRRIFPAELKLKILDEIDANPGQVGVILRREGLYSSHLVQWRRWRNKMGEGGSKSVHNELAKVKRENEKLKKKLQRAETIIDLQKKMAQFLKEEFPEENNEKS